MDTIIAGADPGNFQKVILQLPHKYALPLFLITCYTEREYFKHGQSFLDPLIQSE
jgi:hypothetical protein